MTTDTYTDAGDAEAMIGALRNLRVDAPPSVGFGALVETGLANRYGAIETPLGRAFVAWNGRGVSWRSRVRRSRVGSGRRSDVRSERPTPSRNGSPAPFASASMGIDAFASRWTCAATRRSRSWSG